MNLIERIEGARRKIAGFILGEQMALFMPKDRRGILESGDYEKLSDAELANVTRQWFGIIRRVELEIAKERKIPHSVYQTSNSAMSLIRHAIAANADSLEIAQCGDIAGAETGNWKITVKKLPDDYEFGPVGVQKIVKAKDGRVTKLAYGLSFPAQRKCPIEAGEHKP